MAQQNLWHRPKLRTDEEFERHRSVSWLELYFDLVFVVVIARLAHGFLGNISLHGLSHFLLMFLGVWWVWNAMTYYIERFESEGVENRVFTFLTMIPVAGLAIFAHHGLGEGYLGFALSYLIARSINIAMWVRAGFHEPNFRPVALRFATGFLVTTTIVLVSFLLPDEIRLFLWGGAVLIDILTPNLTIKHQAELPKLSTSKFPERMGLLTIVVLGETVVGVITGLSESGYHLDLSGVVNGILGLWIGFSLWWVYFDYVARRPPKNIFVVALAWNYLHLAMNIAITASGVGIAAVLHQAEIAQQVEADSQMLILLGVGVALTLVALLEMTLQPAEEEPFRPTISRTLKLGSGALLVLLGMVLPAIDASLLLALVLVGLIPHTIYSSMIWLRKEPKSI